MRKGQQLIQRLLAISKKRNILLETIYSHELTDYPLSLTKDGVLSVPSQKSNLGLILQQYGKVLSDVLPEKKSCVVVDAMSIIQQIGKAKDVKTFGEYGTLFYNIISNYFRLYERVDIVFDYYKRNSIKNCTRQKRSGLYQPKRKIVDGEDVPLPIKWENFIHSWENKHDLTNFLSMHVVKKAGDDGLHLVTSGGFHDIMSFDAVKTLPPQSSEFLSSNHEEADTRILLHILSGRAEGYREFVVSCRDTDVLVLLVHFSNQLNVNLYMQTSADKFIHINSIILDNEVNQNLLLFHSLIGCDVTSQFNGIGKKTAWNVYKKKYHLLSSTCAEPFSFDEEKFKHLEQFVMWLYSNSSNLVCNNIDQLRAKMSANVAINKLPPVFNLGKCYATSNKYTQL